MSPLSDRGFRVRFNRALREKGVPAKACSRCYTVKALGQFPSIGGGNLRAQCKACNAARTADYRARNREKVLAAKRRYRAENRDKVRAKARERTAQLRDQYRAKWTAPDGSLIEGDLSLPKRCTPKTNGGCGELKTRGDFYGKRDTADGRYPLCRDCTARRQAADRLKILDALLDEGHDRCHICQGPFAEGDAWEVEHIWPRSDDGDPDDLANLALAHASCNASKHAANPWEFLPRSLAEVGVDFYAAVRALTGQVLA